MLNLTLGILGLFLITLSIIGYGNFICNIKKNYDLFFIIIIGYFVIGSIALFLHFFLPISNFISLVIITFGIFLLFFSKFNIFDKKFIISIFILFLTSIILIGFSEHPIDANMYHHPYVSYLKSEKIIFALANIEFRFGHISLLQYVQSAIINDLIIPLNLSSINIIFFTFFLLFSYEIIFIKKKNKFIFLLTLFISCFVLIKMGRYREYGNDLIPFLVGTYFLIKILDEKLSINNFAKENLFILFPLYCSFMISHKVTYIFSSLIFFLIVSKKNILFIFSQKKLIIFFILFTSLWLIKNYIETSCLVYPVLETCFKNSGWYLTGIADPKSALWLSEIWAKGFIDHPNWENLNLQEYTKDFNWLSTWLNNHFLKILEKISPLIFIMLLLSFYLFIYRKNSYKKLGTQKSDFSNLIFLLFLIGLGLLIWFIKSPLFRYGTFYVVNFFIVFYLLIAFKFINCLSYAQLKNLRLIFILSLIFFSAKNINRQFNSENYFLPLTKPPIDNYEILYQKPKILRPIKSGVCYFTEYICSHEVPGNLEIITKNNYFIFK